MKIKNCSNQDCEKCFIEEEKVGWVINQNGTEKW